MAKETEQAFVRVWFDLPTDVAVRLAQHHIGKSKSRKEILSEIVAEWVNKQDSAKRGSRK